MWGAFTPGVYLPTVLIIELLTEFSETFVVSLEMANRGKMNIYLQHLFSPMMETDLSILPLAISVSLLIYLTISSEKDSSITR